ncbi:MAG TPA: FadD3 family acyl-CoA ligase [Acidimicrobiales bacterium]|nr:FadD3 family acyl-CoA ligase [Acidimicrobiales bacterium]
MSPGADLPWETVGHLARWAFEHHGERPAVVEGGRATTYAELGAVSEGAARALVASGVEAGDRVALWAPNGLEWVAAALGLQLAGGVLVPLSTRYRTAEATYILNRSRARILVTVGEFLGTRYPDLIATQDLPHLELTVVTGAGSTAAGGAGGPATSAVTTWADFLRRADSADARIVDRRLAATGPDDTCDLMFTSGTTGAPKGVVSCHAQTLRAFRQWATIVGLEPGDRYLLVNPMSHSFGYKAGILASLMTGATMVPLPVFDVDAVFRTIPTESITVLPGPPTLYQSLLDHPGRAGADLSSLRLAVTGAAVIPTDLVRRMRTELGFETVITAYGLTEASGFVTACRRGDPDDVIASTSGRAIDGVEVKVVDDSGAEVPRGTPGEIVCRGYNVMLGYFEDPEATAETIDSAGWLHTGDIGTMDGAGNISVTDRKKDMFIVGGFNAYPAEIENVLRGHPGVAQVAVVGAPDGRLGEVPVAFVVPSADAPDSLPEDLVVWAKEQMANYKVPRHVSVVESLPVNASGKVLKTELRKLAAPGRP